MTGYGDLPAPKQAPKNVREVVAKMHRLGFPKARAGLASGDGVSGFVDGVDDWNIAVVQRSVGKALDASLDRASQLRTKYAVAYVRDGREGDRVVMTADMFFALLRESGQGAVNLGERSPYSPPDHWGRTHVVGPL